MSKPSHQSGSRNLNSGSDRNPWVAAALSAFVPGTGQIYAGQRQAGWTLVLVDLVLIWLMAIGAFNYQLALIKLGTSAAGLSLITVASLILLAYRAWASFDAFRAAGGRTRSLWGPGVAALGLVILVPHVALGYFSWVQYTVVTEVFADTTVPVTSPPPTGTDPTTPVTSQPLVARPWDDVDRLNILLIGADTGTGRTGIRTDTMIAVSIDPDTGDAVMVSIPRNFSGINLPEGFGNWECRCFPSLLNDLYSAAEQSPDDFPGTGEPGPRAVKATIGHLLGIDIQYYAMVTLDGFVGLVDALGGVTIDVPNLIVDETYPHEDGVTIENIVIGPGEQLLDGHHALAYARIRRHADDFARMNRQRCVIGAVLEQSSPLELVANYGALAEVMKDSLSTDIPRDRLPDFIDLLPVLSTEKIAIIHVDRDYISEEIDGRSYYDQERIRAETQALIANPGSANLTEELDFAGTCG